MRLTSFSRSLRRVALLVVVLAAGLASSAVEAQIQKASASPRAVLQQRVGLADVTLDYGRPSMRGRRIFGALEPFGRVWRTGANASTKITFSDHLRFAGVDVPSGTFALYTIPGREEWTVILSRNTELWGAGGYDPAQDVLRVQVPVLALVEPQETLSIDFEAFHANGADLVLRWEHTKVSLPVFVDSDQRVLTEITDKIEHARGDVTAATYFDAAMFYFEKELDLEQSARWMDAAIERAPRAFWMVYYRGELALAMGDEAGARRLAEDALRMASAVPNADYGYIAKSRLFLARLEER